MSSQKRVASSGVVMALPPYLTTMVWPEREEREEAMVLVLATKEDVSSSESVEWREDEIMTSLFWCWRVWDVADREVEGMKPFVPTEEATSIELMVKSFMVVFR